MRRSAPTLLPLVLLLAGCTALDQRPPSSNPWPDASAGVADPRLASLCADAWEMRMRNDPVGATYLGDPRYHGDLEDNSKDGEDREAEALRGLVKRAEAIDASHLNDGDRLTLDLLRQDWEIALAIHDLGIDPSAWNLDARGGPQNSFLNLASDQPIATPREREQLIERWQEMRVALDRCGDNLRRGLAAGRVTSRKSAQDVLHELDRLRDTPIEKSPLVAPATGGGTWLDLAPGADLERIATEHGIERDDLWRLNKAFLDAARGRACTILVPAAKDPLPLNERALFLRKVYTIVRDEIYPAFARYRDVIARDVLPKVRDDEHPGLAFVRNGAEYYTWRIKAETSLDLQPHEIHEFGRLEIARIREETSRLGAKVLGTSDFASIQKRLRENPAVHFTSAEEIEKKAEATLRRAEAAVPSAFGIRPKARCEVVRIPDHEAPFTTIAYYRQPEAPRVARPGQTAPRPGRYYINTLAPATRPIYEAEALAFHESVPGHHLQIAIAQELESLPLIRRHSGSTAFVEGWALYTERLADELGLYSSDVDRLGMLSYDAWRASRLVVDTGLHAFGWSRQKAIDYMLDNTLLAQNNIENEVDRYIAWPGQALAYKLGQREIFALRAQARKALGERFRLAEFHDRVLENGAVTLRVLRSAIERWIERERSAHPSTGAGSERP